MFQLALPLDFAVTSEGKTRHAPLLFSPFSTASYAQARSPFPWKFTPFRLRYAPRKAVALLKATLGKSAILPRFIELFGCNVTLPLALPAKIHSFRLRYASCGTVVPLKVTLGKSAILPRFIELFNKRGLTRSPQRLRCAALRLYEQTFHVPSRRAAV